MTIQKAKCNTIRDFQADNPLRVLYQSLLTDTDAQSICLAEEFLRQQLELVRDDYEGSLPQSPEQLMKWVLNNCAEVSQEYKSYLKGRQQGHTRRYFREKSHGLYFLQCVAPTKQVDGAWLYGVLAHWQDNRYAGLLTTYLEELGDGEPEQNHVAIYKRLLADLDCEGDFEWNDTHFHQGAIQLALGHSSNVFMPEIIGFNLGYEQPPLHLLICAYELRELGIDPFYFSLHVTIDNASNGHARRAVQAVLDLVPHGAEAASFWQRVARGYRLNDLGVGSMAVIHTFNLERELVAMLERKRKFGQHMHSDYCRFQGKSVNQWLAEPGQMRGFLQALQDQGWIKRHQDPEDSRFWQLIEGSRASMFGVFNGYEKQLLRDWIAGDWRIPSAAISRRQVRPTIPRTKADISEDVEVLALQESLAKQPREQQLGMLMKWLGPHRHHRPAGLFATRRFIELRSGLR